MYQVTKWWHEEGGIIWSSALSLSDGTSKEISQLLLATLVLNLPRIFLPQIICLFLIIKGRRDAWESLEHDHLWIPVTKAKMFYWNGSTSEIGGLFAATTACGDRMLLVLHLKCLSCNYRWKKSSWSVCPPCSFHSLLLHIVQLTFASSPLVHKAMGPSHIRWCCQ